MKQGEWKPWFPVIDYDRCTNCMQCLSFCLFGVYGVDKNQNLEVQNQDSCKTNCPACSRVCPEAAIMFPKYKSGPINGEAVTDADLQREKMKIGGLPWHGDTFKVVPAIHDFIPTLEYATIINSGNPQTLAWYGRRLQFKPFVNNLEAISRMTYFDIAPNAGVFNLVNEDQAFERLESAFSE